MARIEGIDLPNQKRVEVALTYIYGIGRLSAQKIIAKAGIPAEKRVHELSEDDVGKLRKIIEADHQVEGELRSKISLDIKRLIDIGSYRGGRHRRGLPARGQRTKTNARTRKGKRVTVAGKKMATKG